MLSGYGTHSRCFQGTALHEWLVTAPFTILRSAWPFVSALYSHGQQTVNISCSNGLEIEYQYPLRAELHETMDIVILLLARYCGERVMPFGVAVKELMVQNGHSGYTHCK